MNNLKSALLGFDRQEIAAMKILTSQIAVAAKAEMKAKEQIAKSKVSALSFLESSKAQMDVYRRFSPQTGQGIDPCQQLGAQKLFEVADAAAKSLAREWIKVTAAAPGRFGDPAGYYREQLKVRAKYATSTDEMLGFGGANKDEVILNDGRKFSLAGAHANGSVLFADSGDQRITDAKKAFLNSIAGAPDPALPKTELNNPAAREYLIAKARKDALSSAATYSLSSIAAEHTPSNGVASKMTSLRTVRDLYYGGNAISRWAGWATQDMRGLRVDQLKINSAILAAKQAQYESGQRMEMLMATLVTHEGHKLGAGLSAATSNVSQSASPVN